MRHGIVVKGLIALSGILIGNCSVADGQSAEKNKLVPEIRALRIDAQSPRIDGSLDDKIWHDSRLDFARNFIQSDPDDGKAATESTLVAVAYDDAAVYFAFWCFDSEPEKIARQLVRRDRDSESDKASIRLDPFHDHQTGYMFTVNASGVQRDARIFNDDNSDFAWDGVWDSGVKIQPWGWSAEIKIPYHCIRFSEKDEHVWGVNFVRGITRNAEFNMWAHKPASESGFISKLGHLTGLSGIKPASHLEILPHIVSSLETEPSRPGNPDGRDLLGNVGFDLKYGLTTNLTLDATINPDFGQVELDQPVLNLSTYETQYDERRPFFMEGSELFQSEYYMFYSRRIGRSPQGRIHDDEFCYFTDYPKVVTILGATKLTGKLPGGTSIAFLSAVTEEEKARYAAELLTLDSSVINDALVLDTVSADTIFRQRVVEPRAFYSVLRLKQDVWNNSNVGAIFTLASQNTKHNAVTGAVDWRLLSKDGVWIFRGQSVFSRVDRQNVGFATDLVFEKYAGKHIRGAIGTVFKDPHLHINNLGYTNRNNYRSVWTWLQYRTDDDWWIIRNTWNNLNSTMAWNYGDDNIGHSYNFNNTIQFTNNWYGGMWADWNIGKYDDRETRGHGLWERPRSWDMGFWLDTDERKKLSFEFDYYFGDSRTNPWWGAEFLVRVRPAGNLELIAQTEYVHDFDQLMWVTNPDDTTSIFAEKDQNVLNLNLSASLVINRNLSCQLSAQGLLTGLDYYDYRPYLGGGRYGPNQTGYNNDYNYSALNSTFLVRWEYSPGSSLYIVWTRAREEVDRSANNLNFNRDFDRLFSSGANNVFLVKASHWMNI